MYTRPFIELPVLRSVASRLRQITGSLFENWCIVGVQHLLGTTGSLVQEILDLGAAPSNVFILGKHYSTNDEVLKGLVRLGVNVRVNYSTGKWGGFSAEFENYVKQMWQNVRTAVQQDGLKGILLLDDGGHCIASVPDDLARTLRIVGVEQTTSGIARIGDTPNIPVVAVALSAAKARIEAPLISAAVLDKIHDFLPTKRVRAGVVGLGNIGFAVAQSLRARGHTVLGYDRDHTVGPGIRRCQSVKEIVGRSDFIFGCTGEDALGTDWIESAAGTKVFLSCSSEDREFRGLLTWLYRKPPQEIHDFGDQVEVHLPNAIIRVIRGGYPVNFDRQYESVGWRDIQVTRSLLLAGLAQASLTQASGTYLKLGSELQRFIVGAWLNDVPQRSQLYDPQLIDDFNDLDWIADHSGGFKYESELSMVF